MINKKTTGVPNVDRVTDDIYNHLNKMNSTPVVGLKGERGNTGIQGVPGVTGLQGETGVGFNYQLLAGKGLTGLQFDGTSNVTILKDNYDGYFDYLHRIIANWGTSGTPSLTTNKWVKIAQITLSGAYARASLYADIYGLGSGGQARAKQRVEVNVFNTSTTFDGSGSTIHLDTETISPTSSLDIQIALKDLKVVHRSGSGTTNNVIEVWLQYRSSSIDNLSAQVFYTNGFTVEKFRIAHQDAIDAGYIAIYDRNGYSYSESLALGTINGASGMALAIGGQMSITTLPMATNPNTVLVKESGSDIVKSIPYFSYQGATGAQGLTGLRGLTGIIGNTGVQGITGVVGVTGLRGLTGIVGNTGAQGLTGTVGVTGLRGLTGIIGNTGAQGLTGVVGVTGLRGLTGIHGQQGTTGIGFNYALSPAKGLTGLNYNGTSNVTWIESHIKDFGNGRNKLYAYWGMQGKIANPTGVWVKIASFTLDTWRKVLISGIIRNHTHRFPLSEEKLGVAVYTTDTTNNCTLQYENTNSITFKIFDDVKVLRLNNTLPFDYEVWLHIANSSGSGYAVQADLVYGEYYSTNFVIYEGVLTAYENLPAYDTMYSVNVTGVAGPQGVTGIQGQQGATGVGYNYSLSPGFGMTGLSYNGTGNVSIHKDIKDVYSSYTRVMCNWGTTSAQSGSVNKWVKVATITLNGAYNSAAFYGKIIGRLQGTNSACLQEIHVGVGQGSSGFYTANYMAYLNTINAREIGQSLEYDKNFKDIKLVHVSGSGITNNVVEVWLQYQNNYMDQCLVEVYYRGSNVVMLTNSDAYYDTYPGTYITLLNRNGSAYADNMGLGTSNGDTGICLSVGGNAAIYTTPNVSTTPSYYMVKESGSSEIRQYPWTADHLSAEKSLAIASGDIGWYTIATCPTGRAYGEFLVYDRDTGRHNFCKLQASTAYGKNNLSCTQANRFGTVTIMNARIIYLTADRAYGGAKLQVYVDSNCTLRVRKFLSKDIIGWTGWDDVAPVLENISAWTEDTTTRIEDVTNPAFGLQANSANVTNQYLNGNIYLRNTADNAWLNFAVRDTSGADAVFDLSNIGDITLSGYLQHNALTASRVVVSDSNKRLTSSGVTSSELGLLYGKNSVIDGGGTNNYIPTFSSTYRLTDSPMLSGPYSVSIRNSNWTWGSNFAALQIGNMALWANCDVVNGYGTYISNNRRHDGTTGNMAIVNGNSSTYSQNGSEHAFYVNSGLTAGQAFTPTKIASINASSLDYYPSGGNGISIWGSQGYINTISATATVDTQLQLQAGNSSMSLQNGLILFAGNMYCFNSLTVSDSITAGIDMKVTRYLHSDYVRAMDGSGVIHLSGYNATAAIIFINAFIGHQPYSITTGTQTINPRSGYIQLAYSTSSTYTLGTMPMMVNTRVIIANISGVTHTVVHAGISSLLSSGSFREYIYNVYNGVGTWISEW